MSVFEDEQWLKKTLQQMAATLNSYTRSFAPSSLRIAVKGAAVSGVHFEAAQISGNEFDSTGAAIRSDSDPLEQSCLNMSERRLSFEIARGMQTPVFSVVVAF